MKFYICLILCFFFFFSPLLLDAETVNKKYVDIILDLDQVILFSTSKKSKETIKADSEYWNVAPGASEFVESLLLIPNVRISFFSARGWERNSEALKKIKISDGRTLYDIAEDRVYSGDEMSLENEMKVKDFQAQINDLSDRSAILVDDNVSPVSKNHRKNLLWVYYRDRNKRLAIARGLISAALQKAKMEKMDLADALYQLQYSVESDGEIRFRRIEEDKSYFTAGEALFKKINPNFSFPEKRNTRNSSQSPTHKMKSMIKKSTIKAIDEANILRKKEAKKKKKKKEKVTLLKSPKFPLDCRIIYNWINGL